MKFFSRIGSNIDQLSAQEIKGQDILLLDDKMNTIIQWHKYIVNPCITFDMLVKTIKTFTHFVQGRMDKTPFP